MSASSIYDASHAAVSAYNTIQAELSDPRLDAVDRLAILMAVYRMELSTLPGGAFQVALNAMQDSAQSAWDEKWGIAP